MKAMILRAQAKIETKPLQLVDLPIPEPAPHEVRVQVRACGVCRTDLHVIEGDLIPQQLPLVPGHQVVGVVEKLGSLCKRLRLGDRVGIAWLRATCGSCEFCFNGRENLCLSSRYTGYHTDGGYAEFAVAPEEYVYEVPTQLSDTEAAPLLCAGIIGYRAFKRSNVPRGGRLGIYGFGSSAHITIQVARHRDCEVFVATRGKKHQELARQLGAAWVGDTHTVMPVALDGAIVFAPVGEIVPVALRALKSGGTVALSGIHMSTIPSMPYEECLFHEKNLCSVESNTRLDGRELLAVASQIHICPHVTVFPLAAANEVLMSLKHDGINGTAVLR